jgi:Phasin protein
MAQMESNAEQTNKSAQPNLIPPDFTTMGKKRIEDLVDLQTELLERLQETNRNWFDRVQAEVNLASQLATKLTAARSIPETATAYQEWGSRRMNMAAEDAQHLLADAQRFMETGARLLSNGWLSGSRGIGST